MGRGERGGSGCFKAETPLGPGAGTAQLLKLEQQEWGRKKSRKVGLSCRRAQRPHPATLGFVPAPGAATFGGQHSKGSCPRPGLAGVSWVSQRPPSPLVPPPLLPPSAAALAEGAALKAGTPVPRSRRGREGGGGSQAGMGGPSLPCLAAVEETTAVGDPQQRGGEEDKTQRAWGHPWAPLPGTAAGAWGARGLSGTGAARTRARQPAAGFESGCAVCAQARTGAISGGGWVASPCPHMAAAPLT